MKRVGVIGGGQLAWMMGAAAKKLGVELIVQTPNTSDPAVAIASETVFAPVTDIAATKILASKCDVITFENEFVNLEALSPLAQQGACFRPKLEALAFLLDKYHQRCYLQKLGIPVPKFAAVEQFETKDLGCAVRNVFGFPVVLKSRRHGYDGQGTFIINNQKALQQKLEFYSLDGLLSNSVFLLEDFIPFVKELAVIGARSSDGKVVIYPIVETQQQQQVCRRVIAPADISLEAAAEINNIACTILNSLEAVGVFGIELFLCTDGKVIVNEIAPRTHNSGHFSIDACETSQFEQHLRAICDFPLGNPSLICAGAVMVNLLGYERSESDYLAQRQKLKQIPRATVHWYGKTQSRPGRKLGHVTVLLDHKNRDEAIAIAETIENIWYQN